MSDHGYHAMGADDPEATREQAVARLKQRRDFQSHFIVYVVVNATFWALWATTTDGYPWPAWISGVWGIGLLLNGWDVYLRSEITEADIDRELERVRATPPRRPARRSRP